MERKKIKCKLMEKFLFYILLFLIIVLLFKKLTRDMLIKFFCGVLVLVFLTYYIYILSLNITMGLFLLLKSLLLFFWCYSISIKIFEKFNNNPFAFELIFLFVALFIL